MAPECKTEADLSFVIDDSGSIGVRKFDRVREFVIAIMNELDIDSGKVQVYSN